MPHVNIAKKLMETYNFWDIERTFYERWSIDDDLKVYLLACHQQHTNVKLKISLFDLLKTD